MKLDPVPAETLLKLVDELEQGNAQFNLTAIRDRLGMLQKHVLDSLSLQPYLRGERLADVGTGAGFPGLVLSVVNPRRRFTLIEATSKKARFVEQTVKRLGLDNVLVVNSRAENYRPFELFDTVFARALSSLADFVAYAGHLCTPGGRLLAMKGKRPEGEISALPRAFRVLAVHRLSVPGLPDERHLVEMIPAQRKPSNT
jgi:16S rRNA (guanine527-N7)-methyltransferase